MPSLRSLHLLIYSCIFSLLISTPGDLIFCADVWQKSREIEPNRIIKSANLKGMIFLPNLVEKPFAFAQFRALEKNYID